MKNKTTAILLSVLLGPISWLYTIKKDWWKLLAVVLIWGTNSVFGLLLVLLVVPHIWAVVNAVQRKRDWYESYAQAGFETLDVAKIATLVVALIVFMANTGELVSKIQRGSLALQDCEQARTHLEKLFSANAREQGVGVAETYNLLYSMQVFKPLQEALHSPKNSDARRKITTTCPGFMEYLTEHRLRALRLLVDNNGREPYKKANYEELAKDENDYATAYFIEGYMVKDADFYEKNKLIVDKAQSLVKGVTGAIREKWAKEAEAETTTKESAYTVFINTTHGFSNGTSGQIEGNKKFYKGKYFANWELEVWDGTDSCITFAVPGTGVSWGKFCENSAIEAFEKKYPNYRRGTRFTIKKGKIETWLIGYMKLTGVEI